jgi:uncharacterized protein DUF5670
MCQQVTGLEPPREDTFFSARPRRITEQEAAMLWTIAVILGILWLLGLVSSYTMGGFIHLLLVLAIIVVLIKVVQGRRVST